MEQWKPSGSIRASEIIPAAVPWTESVRAARTDISPEPVWPRSQVVTGVTARTPSQPAESTRDRVGTESVRCRRGDDCGAQEGQGLAAITAITAITAMRNFITAITAIRNWIAAMTAQDRAIK